jgi:diaminopimelate decarboxylase
MHHFHYQNDTLLCESVPLTEIADRVGTPCYVYSTATICRHYRVFDEALAALPHLLCFSVKCNSNGAVLGALARLGAGADIVSGGELFRVQRAGIPAKRIVFSGVGKRPEEIDQALDAGILLFNVESEAELELISRVATHRGTKAPIALRVNPDVDPGTHPYIATGLRNSKFGIPLREAWAVYERALTLPGIEIRGIDCHIGSQLTRVEPLVESLSAVVEMARELKGKGVPLRYVDMGGGLGIRYSDESPPTPHEYGKAVQQVMQRFSGLDLELICEPGRVILGNAGVLLTRVLYRKSHDTKRFVVVDGAMNDLLRPALYGSHHDVWPVVRKAGEQERETVDIVGPICESGDFLAKDRDMAPVAAGDVVALMSAGAYGFSMSSNYNSRMRAAEVLVHESSYALVRERESYDDLVRGENTPEWARRRSRGHT